MNNELPYEEIKKNIEQLKKIGKELESSSSQLKSTKIKEEKELIEKHIKELKNSLKKNSEWLLNFIESTNLPKPLHEKIITVEKKETELEKKKKTGTKRLNLSEEEFIEKNLGNYELEESTIKRLVKKEEIFSHKKIKKASKYVAMASRLFSAYSKALLEKGRFKKLEEDLMKANLSFVPSAYVSLIFFTTLISIIAVSYTHLTLPTIYSV